MEEEEAEIEDGAAHGVAVDGDVRLVEVPSAGAVVLEQGRQWGVLERGGWAADGEGKGREKLGDDLLLSGAPLLHPASH